MASSSRFTWCACRKQKIPSKDTHDLCLHCLGLQHAKEAVLEYGKCPHCAKMDWSTCINRLTKVQEVMHRESQLRKHEAAQSGPAPKPEATPAPVSEANVIKDVVPAPPLSAPSSASSIQSPTFPVMFTILSPPSMQTETNPGVSKCVHLPPLAIQQSGDPGLSGLPIGQSSSQTRTHRSRKRKHFSSCHSRCSKHSKHRHRRTRSPSSSSSSSVSPYWSSSGSSVRERRSLPASQATVSPLLQVMQQKLDAQQQAVQAQWVLLEKRIQALERRPAEPVTGISASTQTTLVAASVASTSSQEETQEPERADWSGPSPETPVAEPILPAVVKHEEEPTSVSAGVKAEEAGEWEDAALLPEGPLSRQDILAATELQSLITRAAKYLGIDFPSTPSNPTCPDPTMVPEFEDLIQNTWSNPASSRPFREAFSKMYRLHECQAPAYDRMPQVNHFMTAIFQAVKPTENKEASAPAKRWRFTETLAERVYQTAGMLARTANYLRYLSDYQKRLLVEITEDRPAQRFVAVLNELRLIGQFTFQLSSHQAELSGRIMAASVAIRRQVWMAKTNYTDALKATVADLPFVVSHTVSASAGIGSSDNGCKPDVP